MLDGLAGWIVPLSRDPGARLASLGRMELPGSGAMSIRCKAVRLWSALAAERATRLFYATLADYSAPGGTLHLPTMPLSRPFFPCACTLRRHIG